MTTVDEIHKLIGKDALGQHAKDEDALALMILLHTYRIGLRGPVLSDRPGVLELAAITQRDAAEAVAAAWPDRTDAQRTDRGYWYHMFNTRTPYEVVEDVPADWMVRVEQMRERVASSNLVGGLTVED